MKKGISIILPVYNEEKNIEEVISRICSYIERKSGLFQIIVVDDGSTDNSFAIIENLSCGHKIQIIKHHKNLGYGQALISGFSAAKFPLCFFMDADGQFDIYDLDKLITYADQYDIIIGSRGRRRDSLYRIILGKIYTALISFLFCLNIKDVNCGFKLIKKEVLDKIKLTCKGGVIDAEILVRGKNKGARIKEVVIDHSPRREGRQTGGSIYTIFRAIRELTIFWHTIKIKEYEKGDSASDFRFKHRGKFIFRLILILAIMAFFAYDLSKEKQRERAKVYLQEAEKYYLTDKIPEAIEAYNKGLELLPSSEGYLNLGIVYSALGQYREAIEAYRKAISLDNNNAQAHSSLGSACYFSGLYQEAVEAYEKALHLDFTNFDDYSNLGMVYGLIGNSQKAMENLEKAISIKSDFPQAYNNLGIEYVRSEEYEKAEKSFKRALEVDPDFSDAYINLFITYQRWDKEEEVDKLKSKVSEIIQANPEKYK